MGCRVTIGMPVYNAEKYISRSIDTVLNQSFEEIELLIVDDCSTDSTVSIIERYQNTHPRGGCIRLLRQEKNAGPSAARNRIIKEAQGHFLYFMDADDTILVNTISTLYETARDYCMEVVYGSYKQIEAYDKYRNATYFEYPLIVFQEKGELASYAYQKIGRFQAQVWNVLFNLEFLRNTGVQFIPARYLEDLAFTNDLVPFVSRAVLLPTITYNYLCRPNTLSNYHVRDKISRNEIEGTLSVMNHIKKGCIELRKAPYVGYRSYNVMMNCFYIVCHIINLRDKIYPTYSNEELQSIMYHPLSLGDIFRSHRKLFGNLILWSMNHLPLKLFMSAIKVIGKMKRAL